MPPVQKMIQEIGSNNIGKLKMLSIREHRFPFLKKVDDWNRFQINTGGTLVEKCCHFFDLMRLITNSEVTQVYASGDQSVNHLNENYNGKVPDILDNAFVILDFKNGIRSSLELCMFAENSEMQEELCVVGDKGKIETGVPADASGKNSSEVRIGLRNSKNAIKELVEVDKKILSAGQHHGSTYYQHLEFKMRILHTMLRVGDLDKSIDFYVNRLGMNLLRKKDYPHGKFTLAFVGYGSEKENSVIELTYNWDKKSEDYELGDKYGHIAIGVKDIHLICQGLEKNGCKITTKPKTMKNSTTVLAFVEDPDGYKIELIERD